MNSDHTDNINQSEPKQAGRLRRRRAWRIVALFVAPAVFSLTTFAVLFVLLEPIVGSYASAAMLFVGNEVYDARPQNRDLLAIATPKTEPAADWVPVEDHRNPGDGPDAPDETAYIKASDITKPNPGDLYANITISGTSVDAPVYWGDSERELNRGVGTYTGGWLPGWGRTVMMAGHRNTDFADLRSVEIGATITVATHYETYTYEVVDIAVYHMNDSAAYDFLRDDENIILYTCHPFDYIGAAVDRLFIYGEPLTGAPVARYT